MKKIIEEVCLIRLLLIILLVLYHSFAPFCGSWDPIVSGDSYPHYFWWIGRLSYSIMLETFTLISGWVFGYQYHLKEKSYFSIKGVAINKFKRLIIPSIVFSFIYILLFNQQLLSRPLDLAYSLINGVGHMWYLPMLFWCFISIILVEKSNMSEKISLIFFSFLSILSFFNLPLRLNYTMYYMIFFYGGFIIGKYYKKYRDCCKLGLGIILFFIFIFIFIVNIVYITPIIQGFKTHSTISLILSGVVLRLIHFIYTCSGTLSLTIIAMYLIHRKHLRLNPFWISLGTYTFGIYIFQQFILELLYYHSSLLNNFSINSIPWIAFILTLILSYIGSILLRKSRFGRFLIG